jgi:hypothetical protein
MDIFIVGHLFGYWCKTLIFRDWWLSTGGKIFTLQCFNFFYILPICHVKKIS